MAAILLGFFLAQNFFVDLSAMRAVPPAKPSQRPVAPSALAAPPTKARPLTARAGHVIGPIADNG